MKKFLVLTFFLTQFHFAFSQDFEFAKITQEDISLVKYVNDTSANAVVLREYGMAFLSSSTVNIVFSYHVRIKILSTKGFDNGNVEIVLHKSDANKFEKVSKIQGTTINVDRNGSIVRSNIDPKQIFKENYNKYNDVVKFALPNLQEGSIIEYSYTIESPYVYNFKTWEFQSHIPKIHSEYYAKIPAVYNYNISLIGFKKLTSQHSKLEKECFTPGGGFKADCSNITFLMKNVPAFIEEDYMTSAKNFRSALHFELKDYTAYNGVKIQVTKEWKNVDHEFKIHDSFGKQYSKKSLFKEELVPVLVGKTDEFEKAKAVYKHIQSRFRWNGFLGKYSDEGIKKALKDNTGNVGDLNLSLIAAMNAAGIEAEPVILSTRDNGVPNKLFPVMSDFNYVVCKVDIGDNSYLLDATEPLLPFGLLPLRCINDQGRVISSKTPSYWIDLKASQKESKYYNINLSLEGDGKLRGKIDISSAGYEGFNKRKKIKSFGAIDDYVEDLDDNMAGVKILKSEIKHLDDLEFTLIESYEVEIEAFENLENDRIIFNPFLVEKTKVNPFKLNERTYPIDWGAPSDSRIVIQIKFPDNYKLQSKPEKIGISLPGSGGKFLSEVSVENSILTLQQVLMFNKSIYEAGEYRHLKELYNQIIKTQQYDVSLKKEI